MRALRAYQKEAWHYLLKNRYAALFMQMRLGKTLCVIRSLKTRARRENIFPVLIVCPYSAFGSWKNELEAEGFDLSEITGTRNDRLLKINQSPYLERFSIINKEGFLTIPELRKERSPFWQWIQLPPHLGERYWQTVSPSCTRQIKTGSTPAECLLEAWLLEGRAMVFHLPCPTPSIF